MSLSCLPIAHYTFIPSSAIGCVHVWFSQFISMVLHGPPFPSSHTCHAAGLSLALASRSTKCFPLLASPFPSYILLHSAKSHAAKWEQMLHLFGVFYLFLFLWLKKRYPQMTRATRWSGSSCERFQNKGTVSFARTARSPLLSIEEFPNRLAQHHGRLNAEQHHVGPHLRGTYQKAHSPVCE